MKSLENSTQISEISSKIEQIFEEIDLKALAESHDFIKKERSLTAESFFKMCIGSVSDLGLTPTLLEHCLELEKHSVYMVPESLNAQFKKEAVNFLSSIYSKIVQSKISKELKINIEASQFSSIFIEDSTKLTLPKSLSNFLNGGSGKSSASAKLNYNYDLLSDTKEITINSGTKSDSKLCSIQTKSDVKPMALYLKDLGYYKISRFKLIIDSGGYLITRYKSDTNVYLSESKEAEPIDLQLLIRNLKPGQFKDMWVYVGRVDRVKMRMVITKLPVKVAAENRRKLKKSYNKRQRTVIKERLTFCDCTIYLTNLDESQFDAGQISKLYGVRWQIEIVFKVWKSIYKMGFVRKMKEERFLCLLYAQLIWIILNTKIFDVFKRFYWNETKQELSELKCFKILRKFQSDFMEALFANSKEMYEDFLNNAIKACQKYGWKVGKKGTPNILKKI